MVPALKGLTLVSSSKNAGYALSSKYYPLLKQLLLPHTAGMGIGVKGLVPRQDRGKHSRRLGPPSLLSTSPLSVLTNPTSMIPPASTPWRTRFRAQLGRAGRERLVTWRCLGCHASPKPLR